MLMENACHLKNRSGSKINSFIHLFSMNSSAYPYSKGEVKREDEPRHQVLYMISLLSSGIRQMRMCVCLW